MGLAHLTDTELITEALSRENLTPLEAELLTRFELSIIRKDDSDEMTASLMADTDLAYATVEEAIAEFSEDEAVPAYVVDTLEEISRALLGLQ